MDTMSKTTWLGILDDARFPQPTSEFLLQLQGSFPHINKKKIDKYLLISNCIKMSRYFLSFRLDGRVIVFPYVNSFSDFDTTLRKERDQDLNNLRALVANNKVRS